MARTLYGATGGDAIAVVSVDDGDLAPGAATFEAYTTRTGTTRHTDLQTLSGGSADVVTQDGQGRVIFYGLDAYTGAYWLEDVANRTSTRWLVNPVDLAERAASGGGSGGGTYNLPAGGIPQTDLAAAVGTKLDNALPKTIVDAKGDLLVGSADNTATRLAAPVDGGGAIIAGRVLSTDPTQSGGVKWSDPAASTAHAASHAIDGADPLTVTVGQVDGLGDALNAKSAQAQRYWDPTARTWTVRPSVSDGVPVRSYSTSDSTASQPPAAVAGDLWFRHPDATVV